MNEPQYVEIPANFLPPDGSKKDDQIARLEQEIQELKNSHDEQKFIWMLIVIVLFDAMIFSNMENWTGPLVIGLVQLIAIVILADRFKVDTVAPLIDKLTGAFGSFKKPE